MTKPTEGSQPKKVKTSHTLRTQPSAKRTYDGEGRMSYVPWNAKTCPNCKEDVAYVVHPLGWCSSCQDAYNAGELAGMQRRWRITKTAFWRGFCRTFDLSALFGNRRKP